VTLTSYVKEQVMLVALLTFVPRLILIVLPPPEVVTVAPVIRWRPIGTFLGYACENDAPVLEKLAVLSSCSVVALLLVTLRRMYVELPEYRAMKSPIRYLLTLAEVMVIVFEPLVTAAVPSDEVFGVNTTSAVGRRISVSFSTSVREVDS
jgi:hypothetical protein